MEHQNRDVRAVGSNGHNAFVRDIQAVTDVQFFENFGALSTRESG